MAYPTSYSISIPIGGLSALLLPFLMWAGSDFENFAQNQQQAVFAFFPFLVTRCRKSRKARETIFSSLVVGCMMYWFSSKHLLCSIYFSPPFRGKSRTATKFTISLDLSQFFQSVHFNRPNFFIAEKLRVKLWKKFEYRKNGKVWGPLYLTAKVHDRKFLILHMNNTPCAQFTWLCPIFQDPPSKWTLSEKFENLTGSWAPC